MPIPFRMLTVMLASLASLSPFVAAADTIGDWFFALKNGDKIVADRPIDSTWVRQTCDFINVGVPSVAVPIQIDIAKSLGIEGKTGIEFTARVSRGHTLKQWQNGYTFEATYLDVNQNKNINVCIYARRYSEKPWYFHLKDIPLDKNDYTGFPKWATDISPNEPLLLTDAPDNSWVQKSCNHGENIFDTTMMYEINEHRMVEFPPHWEINYKAVLF